MATVKLGRIKRVSRIYIKNMKQQSVGHIYIPEWIMAREDLKLIEKIVYGKIVGLTDKTGYCYALNNWIGNQLGLSAKRISFYISHLVELKLIKREVERNENGEVIQRKLFVYQNNLGDLPLKTGGPPPENEHTPPPENEQYIQDEYIQDNNIEVSNNKEQQLDYTADAKEIVNYWNKVRGTAFKSLAFLDNYILWREDYTQAEIMRAINQIKWDGYWGKQKNLDLVWFFRRKDPKGDKIDRIGMFLSAKDPDENYWSEAMEEVSNDKS